MENNSKAKALLAVVCFILGMLLVGQFRSVQIGDGGVPSYQRTQELSSQLKHITDERDMLKREVMELRAGIAEYEESAAKISGITDAMQKELEKVRMASGLLAGTGPGIIVTLDDSNVPKQSNDDPNLFLIHDEDLLKVINELFAAGAEAVSVNDQRIITNSEIRCVGPTVIINSVRVAPPFVIQAVGDADVLESSLKMRGGVIETLQVFGIQVNIKKHDKIEMPSYSGPIQFKHLKPVKAGEKQ